MTCPSKPTSQALAPLRSHFLAEWREHFRESPKAREEEILIWYHCDYPKVLAKLSKVRGFNRRTADAYICGYVRGLRDAVRTEK